LRSLLSLPEEGSGWLPKANPRYSLIVYSVYFVKRGLEVALTTLGLKTKNAAFWFSDLQYGACVFRSVSFRKCLNIKRTQRKKLQKFHGVMRAVLVPKRLCCMGLFGGGGIKVS
jgi:hypothetical protein